MQGDLSHPGDEAPAVVARPVPEPLGAPLVQPGPQLLGELNFEQFVENYLHDASDQVVTGDVDAGERRWQLGSLGFSGLGIPPWRLWVCVQLPRYHGRRSRGGGICTRFGTQLSLNPPTVAA